MAIDGTVGDDTIDGTIGDDTINGLAGNDTILGHAGDDTLNGDDGNDILNGGAGDDMVDGGTGFDFADYTVATNGVHVSLGISGPQDTGEGHDTLINIEGLRGSHFDDILTGSDTDGDYLFGNIGNDTLDGGAGTDTLYGGDGDDTFIVDNVGDVVIDRPGAGTDTVFASVSFALEQSFSNEIENLALTGTANIDGYGNGLDNVINGNSGANHLNGDFGNDTLNGGDGDDILCGGAGSDLVDGGDGNDSLSSCDFVSVDDAPDILIGGLGNDGIEASYGDSVDGGAGVDSLIFRLSRSSPDVVADFSQLTSGGTITIGGATLTGIEYVDLISLTDQADTVVAGAVRGLQGITINGYGGDDDLTGTSGVDFIDGGDGNDVIRGGVGFELGVGPGIDQLNGGAGNDTIYTGPDGAVVDGGTGDDIVFGGTGSDRIDGGAGNDYLDGGAGADYMSGGDGDDTYCVDDPGDTVFETIGAGPNGDGNFGTDTVLSSISFALPDVLNPIVRNGLIENIALIGTDAVNATGNALYNVIIGNAAANVITGQVGADTLTGGAGNDTFQDTAAGLSGDIITDFGLGDRIVITDATLAGFALGRSGNTLTYSGGSLTFGTGVNGTLVASAAAGGGVELTLLAHDVANDFSGDRESDFLLRDASSGWLTDWLGTASGGLANNGANASIQFASDWQVAGTGDFNGDGRDDMLLKSDAGWVTNWLGTASGGLSNNGSNTSLFFASDWHVTGIADFNGDGRSDMLLRNDAGWVTDWLGTASGSFTNNGANTSLFFAPNWQVAGTGDFNGDGITDMLLRRDDGWLTDWLGTASGGFTNNGANTSLFFTTDWHVIGTGDFNGDGLTDMLLRRDDGWLTDWLGTASGGFTNNGANTSLFFTTDWHIASIGDFNGDGRDDILLRNDNGWTTDWLATASGSFANNGANFSTFIQPNWHVQDSSVHLL